MKQIHFICKLKGGDNMSKKMFILNGVHSTGKDTFVKYINEFGVDAVHYSYVDFTRSMLDNAGIDINNKTNEMRKLLCDVNNSLEEYDDIPFKDCCEVAFDFMADFIEGDWLIIDCREPTKIERMKQKFIEEDYYVKTVFIKSNKPIFADNVADKAVAEEFEYDYIIDNTATLNDFSNNIKTFIKEVIGI